MIWFPAHLGLHLASMVNLNEITHARARELTYHAGQPAGSSDSNLMVFRDVLLNSNEVTKPYQLDSRVFPLHHMKIFGARASTLHML
uniref:Putative tick transposon n=1 Tax=Rhipicephalus microplus TaxID=6941 RepID=A0A6M2DAH1_RHIMP